MTEPLSNAGVRSRKDLACTADATAHQREFVKTLQERVVVRRSGA